MVFAPRQPGAGGSMGKDSVSQHKRSQTFDRIKHALESHGVDRNHSFAILAFDTAGAVRVHKSGQVKEHLNDDVLKFEFKRASDQASHESFIASTPQPLEMGFERPDEDQSLNGLDDDDDDDDEEEEPACQSNGTKTKWPMTTYITHQRGRSMLSRGTPKHPRGQYPYPQQPVFNGMISPVDDHDEEPIRPTVQARSFRINETDKVVEFLRSRLMRMQQLADKKIAKAWIKGICPKKQAKFPYSNKKKEKESDLKPVVPPWWPNPITECRFTEPDHIKREERMRLCLHLLRLRPTPQQLRMWNQDKSDPHPIHVNQGWTAFLRELAGFEILEDLPKEDKKRTQQRQDLMRQMYDVAALEEEFMTGGNDGTDVYSWTEDQEDRKRLPMKRTRPVSLPSHDDNIPTVSADLDHARTKRTKGESMSEAPMTLRQPVPTNKCDIDMLDAEDVDDHDETASQASPFGVDEMGWFKSSNARIGDSYSGQYEATPFRAPIENQADFQGEANAQGPGWHNAADWSSCPTTMTQAQGGQFASTGACYTNDSMPQGGPSYDFQRPFHHAENVLQVQIPEPQFQSVPTTSMFCPADMALMPWSSFMPQSYEGFEGQHLPNVDELPPSTFVPPATGHANEGFPVPTARPQHRQASRHNQRLLAQQHMSPMQCHGLPHR